MKYTYNILKTNPFNIFLLTFSFIQCMFDISCEMLDVNGQKHDT